MENLTIVRKIRKKPSAPIHDDLMNEDDLGSKRKTGRKRATPAKRSVSKKIKSTSNETIIAASAGVLDPGEAITHPQHSASSRPRRTSTSTPAAATRAPNIVQDSPLLLLPKEIQLRILSFLLVKIDRPIKLQSSKDRRWRNEVRKLKDVPAAPHNYHTVAALYLPKMPRLTKSTLLDLLAVCKSFYYIGIEAFYGENVLHFDCVAEMRRFVGTLGSDRRRCIKRIEVDMRCFYAKVRAPPDTSEKIMCYPMHFGDLDDDPLEELPTLQKVIVRSGFDRAQHVGDWVAAKAEVERKLREAWSSKAEVLHFDWTSEKEVVVF